MLDGKGMRQFVQHKREQQCDPEAEQAADHVARRDDAVIGAAPECQQHETTQPAQADQHKQREKTRREQQAPAEAVQPAEHAIYTLKGKGALMQGLQHAPPEAADAVPFKARAQAAIEPHRRIGEEALSTQTGHQVGHEHELLKAQKADRRQLGHRARAVHQLPQLALHRRQVEVTAGRAAQRRQLLAAFVEQLFGDADDPLGPVVADIGAQAQIAPGRSRFRRRADPLHEGAV
jgi:hypothetical protein